ncbi:MAG: hypothetical protein AB1798_07095 [Spirochaetota bacterium]
MLAEIGLYLEKVCTHLHLDPQTEKKVVRELYTYFQEKMADLERQGVSGPDAVQDAIRSFGSPKLIARLMYEAYSSGSWAEALLSAQPHLFIAFLFVLHLWQQPVPLLICFAFILLVALYGWTRELPNWLYSWIGCSFIPLGVACYLSRHLIVKIAVLFLQGIGAPLPLWQFILPAGLYGGLFWIVLTTILRVIKIDWIFVSLTLMPIPILGFWLLSVDRLADIFNRSAVELHSLDAAMTTVLTMLAVVSALFTRFRPRIFKFAVLLAGGIFCVIVIVYNVWGNINFARLLAVTAFMLLFLLGPALLQTRVSSHTLGSANRLEEWIDNSTVTR